MNIAFGKQRVFRKALEKFQVVLVVALLPLPLPLPLHLPLGIQAEQKQQHTRLFKSIHKMYLLNFE